MFRVVTRNISAYPARPLPGECMPDRATLLPKSLLEQSRTHSIAALPCAPIQAGHRAILEHFRIARMAAEIRHSPARKQRRRQRARPVRAWVAA